MTNLLEKFDLSGDIFSAVADAPEVFESSGRTTTLHLNRRIPFNASIPGKKNADGTQKHTPVTAYATLREASLSRMSVIDQTSPNSGNAYKLVTGVFKPVKVDIEVMIDGEMMTLPELLRAIVNQSSQKEIDEQTFLDTANRIGLTFADGMPLFWQQFGASEEGIAHAFEAFKAAGAVDVLDQIKKTGTSTIVKAYAHATGIPVTSFEIGTVNREASRTNQGFLNLVDASVDQFNRIVGLRKEASLVNQELTAQTDWSQKKIKDAENRVKVLSDMSRQWRTNWAGAQRVIQIAEGGKKIIKDQYAAVNAPCGRFAMIIDGQTVNVDLWKNSARAESTNTVIDTVNESGEELPF